MQCHEKTLNLTVNRTVLGTSMFVLTQRPVWHTWLPRRQEGLLRWFLFATLAQLCCCQMAQSPVSCHMNVSKGSVLIGQTWKFKPDKIGMSCLFISVCCSVCFYFVRFICPLNDQVDSEQRRMRDTSLCLSDTVWKICCFLNVSFHRKQPWHVLLPLGRSTCQLHACVTEIFSISLLRKMEKSHTKNFSETLSQLLL